ncbi:glycosyltransferase [Lithospermum erythrorhizon]|uniref:Fucosyltransferase n=1 Tax=Lithospermum erythrorhizon TaxID=34254 RepID=A0AAV3RYB7_LITER
MSNQRLSRMEDSTISVRSSINNHINFDANNNNNSYKRKCTNLLPIFVGLVVIAELTFLGRLDLVKNADLVNSFYQFTTSSLSYKMLAYSGEDELESCEAWLEKEDSVQYFRDFRENPIFISGEEEDFKTCDVGCKFKDGSSAKVDAAFATHGGVFSVLRSMESSKYYPEINISTARRNGYNIVMTTSLSSDVPVGYFSWAEYDIMAPVQPKTEKALAAAFISNCQALNFRLQALKALERAEVKIDSYGSCHRNRGGKVDKVETLKRYKFSFAFENSNEDDYVTEKFFQSLVAGSVPVVVGAPNIQDFAPAPGSLLHIKELRDANEVSKTMKYLAENPSAYNKTLRWKYEGPSDSFKALIDMSAVHSSCRLCIFLATKIREKEEENPNLKKRPCMCTRGSQTVYHLYVRERGRFEMTSIFLRSDNLTVEALEAAVLLKFKSLNHVPVWKDERPKSIRSDELKLYRIYPLSMTQRQALYTFKFKGNTEFENHIKENHCSKFEVIFV